MRYLLGFLLVSAATCGPASTKCTQSTVGAVAITIDNVPYPSGAGDCASASSSHIDIHIGGPQKAVVQLEVSEQVGSFTCDGPYLTASLDGTGEGFATSMIGQQGYIAGGNRQAGTCTRRFVRGG